MIFACKIAVQVYVREELIHTFYPLHDDADLEKLGSKWYWAFFQTQPFGKQQID